MSFVHYIYVIPPMLRINDIIKDTVKFKDYLKANDVSLDNYSLRTFRDIDNNIINNIRIVLGLPEQQYYSKDCLAPLYYDLVNSPFTVNLVISPLDITDKLFNRNMQLDKKQFYIVTDDKIVKTV